jgi:hypothetical protein
LARPWQYFTTKITTKGQTMSNVSVSNVVGIASNIVSNSELLNRIKNTPPSTDYIDGGSTTMDNIEKYLRRLGNSNVVDSLEGLLINVAHEAVFGNIWEGFPESANTEYVIARFKLILYIIKNNIEIRRLIPTGGQWEEGSKPINLTIVIKGDPDHRFWLFPNDTTLEDRFLILPPPGKNPLKRGIIEYSLEERSKKWVSHNRYYLNALYGYDVYFNNNCYKLTTVSGETITLGNPKYFDDDNIEIREEIYSHYNTLFNPDFTKIKITDDSTKEKTLKEKHQQLIKILECV